MSEEGTIEQQDGQVTFRYERQLRHPIEVVWGKITDPSEIERWTGSRPEIDLRVGGAYVTHHRTGDRVVDRVVAFESLRRFAHTFWAQVNPSAIVTWELDPTDDGCRLSSPTRSQWTTFAMPPRRSRRATRFR